MTSTVQQYSRVRSAGGIATAEVTDREAMPPEAIRQVLGSTVSV